MGPSNILIAELGVELLLFSDAIGLLGAAKLHLRVLL